MSETKLCPFCAEEIKAAAVKCKHCGSMIEDAAPKKNEAPPHAPDLPPQAASPVSSESVQEQKPTEEPALEPQRKYVYSIILKKFDKDKVTLLARRLREVLQIPYENMGDYVTEGKTLTSNLEENDANKLMQSLSIPGVEFELATREAPLPSGDDSTQKPEKVPTDEKQEILYSVVVDAIEDEKAKFAFGKKLSQVLSVPYNQIAQLTAPGKTIKSDMEEENAKKLLEALSTPGVILSIKTSMPKLFWGCISGTIFAVWTIGGLSGIFGLFTGNVGFLEFTVYVVIFVCAIWVYHDTTEVIGMEDERARKWTVCVFLLSLFIFPYYLIKRKEFLQQKDSLDKLKPKSPPNTGNK